MPLTIRDMEPADAEEVVRIIRLHDTDDARHAGAFFETGPAFDGDPRHRHLVCEQEGQVVGVCGYGADMGEGEGVYWLGWTYVNPWRRGQGIGRRLLEAVVERVRALGGRKLYAETSSLEAYAAAVRFYARAGFAQEGRLVDYYAPGDDKLILGMVL